MQTQTEANVGKKNVCFPVYSYEGHIDLCLPVHMIRESEGEVIEHGRFAEKVKTLCGDALYVSHVPPTIINLAKEKEVRDSGLHICQKCLNRYELNFS